MKTTLLFLILSVMTFGISQADVLSLAPTQATVLPSDGSGTTRVALKFDASGIHSGAGRQIIVANLDWPLDGFSQNEPVAFNLKAITGDWSVGALQGASAIQSSSEPSDTWLLGDLEREQLGGFLRFRVPDLVQAWLDSPSSNYGVLVTFENEAPGSLQSQLGKAQLVVHYLFVPVEQ